MNNNSGLFFGDTIRLEWFRGDNISLAPIIGLHLAAPDVEETPLFSKEPGFHVYKSAFYLENGLIGHQ